MWIIMNNCYLCRQVLSKENESVEHIIPNSIGGRLKSKKLLCKKCNSKLGTEYDSEVSKMFNASMIIFGVKKDNNKNLSKEKFYDRNFNNMPFEFERNKTGIKINFNQIIRNKDSISVSGNKKFVEEKKKELLKNNTRILKNESVNVVNEINLNREDQIDKERLFKSILKTGIGFYLENKNNVEKIENVIENLSQENNFNKLKNIVEVRETKRTNNNYHSLFLFKNPITTRITCYVLYFSKYFNNYFKVELSKNYIEKNFDFDFYLYNLIKNTEEKEISKKIQYEIETMLNKELENKENDSRELNEVGETIEELMINMIITNML